MEDGYNGYQSMVHDTVALRYGMPDVQNIGPISCDATGTTCNVNNVNVDPTKFQCKLYQCAPCPAGTTRGPTWLKGVVLPDQTKSVSGTFTTTCDAGSSKKSTFPSTSQFSFVQSGSDSRTSTLGTSSISIVYKYSSQNSDPMCGLPALNSASGWCASTAANYGNEYLIMDLGSVYPVKGIITQGRRTSAQWVTQYQYVYSNDATTWTQPAACTGNVDQNTMVTCTVSFSARYVKVIPMAMSGYMSMRAGVSVPGARLFPRRF